MVQKLNLYDNSLHNLIGGTWHDREVKCIEGVTKINYEKLCLLARELNPKLRDKDFLNDNLLLWGENYEHNTDDDLFNVLGWNDDNYMIETGNLVGYVSTKDYNLNISSRFGDSFLLYLLRSAEGFLEIPEMGTADKGGFYEWLMTLLWKQELGRAYRLGMPKQYIPRSERLYTVKGNVDVLNYAINRGMDGRTLCHYYQHQYNNPVTKLIAYTFSKIGNKGLISDCIRLKSAFEQCVEGEKTSIEACLNTRPISNPYYADYNKVIRLSKSILRRQYGDITNTSNISSAFLFDMSMLFEHRIRKILKDEGMTLLEKNDDSMTISRGLGKPDDRHLYPDIVIVRGDESVDVYDVKYKHFDSKYGIKREDLFQLHTYVLYLSNFYKINSCGIIYPKLTDEHSQQKTTSLIQHPCYEGSGIPLNVLFYNIPKQLDNDNNNKDKEKEYIEKIEQEEREFANAIKGKLLWSSIAEKK